MIEIFSLIFLCRRNGNLALQKGLSAGKWKWYTILGWFAAEIVGVLIGMILFGYDLQGMNDMKTYDMSKLYGLEAIGLISAFGGYLIVRSILDKKPDSYEEDINKINVSDLRPPQKNQ